MWMFSNGATTIPCFTDGPAATIREVIPIPLARPREKRSVMHDPRYLEIKEHLLSLLQKEPAAVAS